MTNFDNDKRMDWTPQDNPGLSLSDQYPNDDQWYEYGVFLWNDADPVDSFVVLDEAMAECDRLAILDGRHYIVKDENANTILYERFGDATDE